VPSGGTRRRLSTLASIVAVLLTFVGGGSSVTAGADDDCPNILVVGMRGSGEPAEGDDGIGRTTVKFWQEFRPRVPTGRTVELWANPYPAVAALCGSATPWIRPVSTRAQQPQDHQTHPSRSNPM
jgi:hypothetical protein